MSVRVLEGDCRDVLKTLPDACVDLVLTDPPYGDTVCDWDTRVDGWLSELPRVMKPSASLWCFGSMRFFMERASDFKGWRYAQDVVWEKHNGSNSFADRFKRVHEHVVQFYPSSSKWSAIYKNPVFSDDAVARAVRRKQRAQHWSKIESSAYMTVDGGPRMLRSVLVCRSEHGRALHPTQKPELLLAPIVEYSCPPGGMVLDCFAGSGTTGATAKALDRDAILIELDSFYVEVARERIASAAPLFAEVE